LWIQHALLGWSLVFLGQAGVNDKRETVLTAFLELKMVIVVVTGGALELR